MGYKDVSFHGLRRVHSLPVIDAALSYVENMFLRLFLRMGGTRSSTVFLLRDQKVFNRSAQN